MDERQAVSVFGALSQATRLCIVRLLVKAGPLGMPAGAIAEHADVGASNVSFHLKELEHASMVSSRREARSIIYSANYDTLSGLIQFLMEDCCQGRPEICNPMASTCAPAKPVAGKKIKAGV